MKAQEIRDRWVEPSWIDSKTALKGELVAQVADLVQVLRTFTVVHSAAVVAESSDPEGVAQAMAKGLETFRELMEDDEEEEDENPNQCACNKQGY